MGQHGCSVNILSMLLWKSLYPSGSLEDVLVLRKAWATVGTPPVCSSPFSGKQLPYQLAPESFATCWTLIVPPSTEWPSRGRVLWTQGCLAVEQ